jgi:deoxycytidylate deaminase
LHKVNVMPLKDVFTIGLTGSFGSGCSSLKDVLVASEFEKNGKIMKFKGFSLSDPVKDKWLEQNWERFQSGKPLSSATEEERKEALKIAKRSELQDIGNEIRKKRDSFNKLAMLTISKAYRDTHFVAGENALVFSSIRNTAEVKALREKFPNFYLIAVDCEKGQRWSRIRDIYERNGQNEKDFWKDDERDRGEDTSYGQQVELCVDEADIMMKNDDPYPDRASIMVKLQEKIEPFIKLLSGKELRTPTDDEFFMSLAYTASLNSKCFKRQVGAVVVDANKNVLSVGYNENLKPHLPCVENPGDCHRDIYKRLYFQRLKNDKTAICPQCKKPLNYSPEFKCKNCNTKLDAYYIPDKALSRCTALHAEARALRALKRGELQKGSVLYTTASPCLLCAVDIANAGVHEVVYSEAYTDTEAMEFLKKEDIYTKKFEGVKAQAYFKLFCSWREQKEAEIKKRVERF